MATDLREYTLSLNEFNRPKILTAEDTTCVKLMQLILLEKGTYPTRPDMGLGIVSRYRYTSPDNVSVLESDLESQIDTYLPELIATDITVTAIDKNLNIAIIVDEVVYTLIFNSDTTTLASL